MTVRPYNDPANILENGQPRLSENAWEISEQFRIDRFGSGVTNLKISSNDRSQKATVTFLGNEVAKLENKVAALKEEINSLKAGSNQLAPQLHQMSQTLDQKIAKLSSDVAVIKSNNLQNLQNSTVTRLSHLVTEMEKHADENDTQINALIGLVAGLTQQHNANRSLISHHKAATKFTTVGGAATEEFIIAKVAASDQVTAQLHTVGASPVTIVSAKCLDGKISVTFSGDPADDHIVSCSIVGSI